MPMRVAFLLVVLFASGFYTYVAFADLAFLSVSGRLGPGFFPRLIGILLMAFCLWGLWSEFKRGRSEVERASSHWRTSGLVVVLTGGLVLSLNLLGGVLAMAAFLLVSLSLLNRGHHRQNLAVAVVFPGSIYLLFDRLLNAAMPDGVMALPF